MGLTDLKPLGITTLDVYVQLLIALFSLVTVYSVYTALLHPLRHIPGPLSARLTFIPLALQCRRARRSAWVHQQHIKYGPFVRVSPDHVSISRHEAVDQIYGHKAGFLKGPFYEDKYKPIQTSSLSDKPLPFNQVEPVVFNTRSTEIHRRKRKHINPAFSAKNLQDFEPHMNPLIRLLVAKLQSCAEQSEPLDFCRWSNYLAFDVIGEYAFGESFSFLSTGRDDYNLIHTIDTRGEVLNALGHLPLWLRPYMRYLRIDSFWYNGLRATASLESIGRAAFAKRKAEKGEHSGQRDLMSFLLNARDPETGEPLREREIIAEAISFIVGGSDTTSSTMTNVVDFVSRDLDLQKKMFDELKEAFPDVVGGWVAEESVAGKLPFLNAVVKEVMRVRPTSSTGLERVVPAGGREIAGVWIPAGKLVSVPTVDRHYDEDVFKNPSKLDPQRWLEADANELTTHFIPFSVGPRACLGRNFAWMEMLKTLATLFRLFQLERTLQTPTPTREGFFVKVAECEVRVTQRV